MRTLTQKTVFSEMATALWGGQPISAEGIVGSSSALAVAALFQHGNGSLILVAPDVLSAEQIAEDAVLFLEPEYRSNVLLFPPMTRHDDESESALAMIDEPFGERIGVLKRLVSQPHHRYMIMTSMPALLQPVPPPTLVKERTQTLAVNCRVDLESLRRFLIEGGYHSTSAVDLPGEFAVRGYILDLFAPDWDQPVRIEFFNDEIESIRRFDLTTQRSLEKIAEIDLTRLQPYECTGASLLDYFSPSIPIVLVEPASIQC
jgi:transcription-repair coupling factor (superfamily II helicase)